jgi:hypothetical protein
VKSASKDEVQLPALDQTLCHLSLNAGDEAHFFAGSDSCRVDSVEATPPSTVDIYVLQRAGAWRQFSSLSHPAAVPVPCPSA